jgi:hypothetical protein
MPILGMTESAEQVFDSLTEIENLSVLFGMFG